LKIEKKPESEKPVEPSETASQVPEERPETADDIGQRLLRQEDGLLSLLQEGAALTSPVTPSKEEIARLLATESRSLITALEHLFKADTQKYAAAKQILESREAFKYLLHNQIENFFAVCGKNKRKCAELVSKELKDDWVLLLKLLHEWNNRELLKYKFSGAKMETREDEEWRIVADKTFRAAQQDNDGGGRDAASGVYSDLSLAIACAYSEMSLEKWQLQEAK